MAGKTILLRPCSGRKDEAPALGATLKPGMLVTKNAAGQLIPHATADGFGPRKVVVEDAVRGKTVEDAYAASDMVPFYNMNPEGKFNLRCKHGSNYTVGTLLASAGDGTFQPAGAGTKQVFGQVVTALDLTAAGAPALVECDGI